MRVIPSPVLLDCADALKSAQSIFRQNGQVVLIVPNEPMQSRCQMRLRVRQCIAQFIETHLALKTGSLDLGRIPGQAPSVRWENQVFHTSISHSHACSVTAIHAHRRVGVDVLGGAELAGMDSKELIALAEVFLPRSVVRLLSELSIAERPVFLMKAWSEHEAMLKCRNLELREWDADLENQLHGVSVCSTRIHGNHWLALAVDEARL